MKIAMEIGAALTIGGFFTLLSNTWISGYIAGCLVIISLNIIDKVYE